MGLVISLTLLHLLVIVQITSVVHGYYSVGILWNWIQFIDWKVGPACSHALNEIGMF